MQMQVQTIYPTLIQNLIATATLVGDGSNGEPIYKAVTDFNPEHHAGFSAWLNKICDDNLDGANYLFLFRFQEKYCCLIFSDDLDSIILLFQNLADIQKEREVPEFPTPEKFLDECFLRSEKDHHGNYSAGGNITEDMKIQVVQYILSEKGGQFTPPGFFRFNYPGENDKAVFFVLPDLDTFAFAFEKGPEMAKH